MTGGRVDFWRKFDVDECFIERGNLWKRVDLFEMEYSIKGSFSYDVYKNLGVLTSVTKIA